MTTTSTSVRTDTAYPSAGDVTLILTAWMAAMSRIVALQVGVCLFMSLYEEL